MRCPNCQTLNPVNAKYCLECGNRLVICPNCGTINLPFAKFCIECGTALQLRGDTDNTLQAVAREKVDPPTPEVVLPPEERRVVTVIFADIIGSTPLAAHIDPEDMRAILTGYFNLMTQQIRKHGGTVEKYIGDAVMAVFGTPITHEDDPDRAIRASLDMQNALALFNEQRLASDGEATRLQMRIGINTGEVAVPTYELNARQDFLITGDAVNVAARLQQVAMPDTILVGERTYLATRDAFDFRPVEPLQLKGKADPLIAFIVQESGSEPAPATQHPRGLEGLQVPLVGRSLELTLLHTTYARVLAEHNSHLITIIGVPGIGKSRLVREFVTREQESAKSTTNLAPLVLQGRCPPYGESITYWPLVEIMRSLLQVRDDESNEALQIRFTQFVSQTLANAHRAEASDEIANTILRSIGRNLDETDTTSDRAGTHERPKREYQRSSLALGTKQTTAQAPLQRAWRIFIESLAQSQPLLIVVDDLQWADEALLDLLEYLTERITSVPVLFLCPARPDFFDRRRDWGGGQRNFTTIELDSLSAAESSNLIDALLNTDDLPEVLRNTILTRAEGNPFFVEEIIRMFIDQGLLVHERETNGDMCWRLGATNETLISDLTTLTEPPEDTLLNLHYTLPLPRVPDTVQGVLAARVDLLHPLEKFILQHAAIIGRTFWLSSLVELTHNISREVVLRALDSLMYRGFVIEDDEEQIHSPIEMDRIFSFKHILIRDVVYNNIPRARRSEEHAQLAFWLEIHTTANPTRYIELLAYHYQQALITWSSSVHVVEAVNTPSSPEQQEAIIRLTRPELRRRAIKYLTLAGDQAMNSYYTLRALQAYNDALELLLDQQTDVPALVSMYEKLGDAYSQRGTQEESWQSYRKALRIATGDDVDQSQVDVLYLYERLSELGTRWLGGFNTPPGTVEVRGYIDAGLKLLEGKALSPDNAAFLTYSAFWYIRQLESTTYAQKAELAEQALSSGYEALQLAEQLDNPSVLSLALDAVGFIYSEYCRYNEALQIQRRRQQLEDRLTDREELYDLYISLGKVHTQVADYATALTWFGRAWNSAQTMESPFLLLNSMAWRMWTWLQWNRWQEAHDVALDILRLIDQYQQDEKRQLWALETLAMITYRQGNVEAGEQYARQYKRLVDIQDARTEHDALPPVVSVRMRDISLARRDWERATAEYKEKLRTSEPLPSPEVLATLAELLVITGEDAEEQEQLCARAIEAAEKSGARKSLALAFRARGRMYMKREQWALAKDDLCQALQRCEALDLPWERGITLYCIGLLYKLRASTLDKDASTRASTDLERSRYHFERALGFFEYIGATPDIERVRQELTQKSHSVV